MTDKIKAQGELNGAVEYLERAAIGIEDLWNEGISRLSKEDIADCEEKLRKARQLIARIKGIIDLFDNIANHKLIKEEVE